MNAALQALAGIPEIAAGLVEPERAVGVLANFEFYRALEIEI